MAKVSLSYPFLLRRFRIERNNDKQYKAVWLLLLFLLHTILLISIVVGVCSIPFCFCLFVLWLCRCRVLSETSSINDKLALYFPSGKQKIYAFQQHIVGIAATTKKNIDYFRFHIYILIRVGYMYIFLVVLGQK